MDTLANAPSLLPVGFIFSQNKFQLALGISAVSDHAWLGWG